MSTNMFLFRKLDVKIKRDQDRLIHRSGWKVFITNLFELYLVHVNIRKTTITHCTGEGLNIKTIFFQLF